MPRGRSSSAASGRPRCLILQPTNASGTLRTAARSLQAYLKLATGADIPLLTEGARLPSGLAVIHLGDTARGLQTELDLPELRYGEDRFPNLSGFLVKTLDRHTLVIRGPNDRATAHGVVGLLQRYVGVRQYWPGPPGDLGDVIPRRERLSIPDVEWRDWPYGYSFTFSTEVFSGAKGGNLDFYRRRSTLPCNENYFRWLPPEQYAAAHPEYYPLINGVRRVPGPDSRDKSWQPCVAHPEVARIMGGAVVEYLRQHPDEPGINFAINDGGGDCMCEGCRALDAPPTAAFPQPRLGDRYVKLTNRVAEQLAAAGLSNRWLVYLAYASARPAPRTVRPHPQVLPVLTSPGNTFRMVDEWLETGVRHLGLYVHHNDSFFVLPKWDLRQMERRLRYALGTDRLRVFYMEQHAQWPFGDLVPYLTAALLWDPRQDVEALLDEYYQGFYGPAAAAMRAFHAALEAGYERWLAQRGAPHPFGRDVSSIRDHGSLDQFRVLAPEEAAQARRALEAAVAATPPGSRERQRVELIRSQFHLQDLAVQWAWTVFRLLEEPARTSEEARRVVEDVRRVHALGRAMRDYITQTLEQPPLAAHRLFRRSGRPLALYAALKSGDLPAEVRGAVEQAVYQAADRLRETLGAAAAREWWQTRLAEENAPELRELFEVAARRAGAPTLVNLLPNPGFEDTPGPVDITESEQVLDYRQAAPLGIHHWFPERSPGLRYTLSSEARTGRWALSVEGSQRSRFSRHVSRVEPGARYRLALWFKHNEAAADYRFAVAFRLQNNTYPEPVVLRVPHRPGRWQELTAEVTAPPGARGILLRLSINGQTPAARCWLDDAFIGKYPTPDAGKDSNSGATSG